MPTAGMAGRPSRTATLSMPQGSKRVPLQKHGTAAGGHSPAERPSHAGEINSGSCLEKRDIGEKEKAQAPHPSHTGLLPSLVCPAVPESVRRRKSITAALNNQSARLNSANPAATASPLSGMLEGTSITAETPPPRPFQMGTHHRRHDEGFSFNAGAREGRNHSFSGASSNKYGLAGESKIMKIVLPRLPPVDAVELTTSPPAPHEQQFDAIELPFDPANTSGNVRKRSMSVDRAGSSTPASEPQSFPGSRPRTGRSHSVHEVEKCQLPKLNADERLTSNKSRSKSRASPSLPKVGGAQNSSDHDEDNDERCEHGKANKSTHVCPHHRSHSQRLVAMSFSDLDAILDAEKRIAALQEVAVDDSSKKSRPPSRYRSQPSLPTGGQSPGSPNRLRRVLGYLSHPDFLNFNDLNALADAMSLEAFQRVAPHVTKIKGSWKMRWEKELKERGIRDMIKPNRPPSSSNVSNAKERKKPERRGTNSSDKLGGKTATPSCRVEEHDYETGQATLESSKSNETDIGKNVPENESGCIGDGCVPLDPRLTDYCVKGGSIGDVPLNSVATSITFKASASWNAKLSKAVKIQLANAVDSGCATQSVEIPPGLDSTQTRLNDNTLESSQDAQYKNSDDKSSNTLTQEAELMYDEKWRDDGEHGIPQVPHGTESGEGILQSGQHSSIQSAGTRVRFDFKDDDNPSEYEDQEDGAFSFEEDGEPLPPSADKKQLRKHRRWMRSKKKSLLYAICDNLPFPTEREARERSAIHLLHPDAVSRYEDLRNVLRWAPVGSASRLNIHGACPETLLPTALSKFADGRSTTQPPPPASIAARLFRPTLIKKCDHHTHPLHPNHPCPSPASAIDSIHIIPPMPLPAYWQGYLQRRKREKLYGNSSITRAVAQGPISMGAKRRWNDALISLSEGDRERAAALDVLEEEHSRMATEKNARELKRLRLLQDLILVDWISSSESVRYAARMVGFDVVSMHGEGNSTDRRDDVLKKPEAGRASRLSMIQSEIDGREDDISKAKMMPQALILTVEKEKLDTSVSPSHFSHTSKSSEDFINDSELVPMDRADEHETVAISLSNILPKGPVPAGRKGRKGGRNDLDDLDLNGWVGGNAERGTSKTPYVVAVNDGVV